MACSGTALLFFYCTHVIDGQVVQIERGNPKLKKGAVPSILSCDNLKGIRVSMIFMFVT
jgi:hypothetical protein